MTIEDQRVTLQIWDTAGEERYLSIGTSFYKGADCCAIVYDVTKPMTFDHVDEWHRQFLQCAAPSPVGKSQEQATQPPTAQIVLLGNKVDLESERKVPEAKALGWCKSNGNIPHFETSAKDGTQIKEAFNSIAALALKSRFQASYIVGVRELGRPIPGGPSAGLKLKTGETEKKGCAC